jgi:membrane protein
MNGPPMIGLAWSLVRQTLSRWVEDRAPRLGAALAYYTLFALAPLLMIVIAVAGLVFGQAAAEGRIVEQIEDVVGADAARALQAMIASARRPGSGLRATLIGVAVVLLGASGLVTELQDALNFIWRAPPRPRLGVLATVRGRLISLALVVGIGFLFLVSLASSAALAAAARSVGEMLPGQLYVAYGLQLLNFVLSVGAVTVLFATIYKFLPDVDIAWSDVWVGAGFTALLFTIGETLVGLYLGVSSVGSPYGAAGSIVVLLVWVYYSAQLLFLGAEFTWVYAHRGPRAARARAGRDAGGG